MRTRAKKSRPARLRAGSGVAIASGAVAGGTGLTFGAAEVTATDADGVPAGKGLRVRITGGAAGVTYEFALTAALSNGRELVATCKLQVSTG